MTPDDFNIAKMATLQRAIEILQDEMDKILAPDSGATWADAVDSSLYSLAKRIIETAEND